MQLCKRVRLTHEDCGNFRRMADRIDNPWEDLVLAILSVNKYSLEKTFLVVETLRGEGLFQPENLVRWTPEEIGVCLKRGGYDRGDFMTRLFADRLASLGMFVKSTGVKECERVLRSGGANTLERFLFPVRGIGPKVVENFVLLRSVSSQTA